MPDDPKTLEAPDLIFDDERDEDEETPEDDGEPPVIDHEEAARYTEAILSARAKAKRIKDATALQNRNAKRMVESVERAYLGVLKAFWTRVRPVKASAPKSLVLATGRIGEREVQASVTVPETVPGIVALEVWANDEIVSEEEQADRLACIIYKPAPSRDGVRAYRDKYKTEPPGCVVVDAGSASDFYVAPVTPRRTAPKGEEG